MKISALILTFNEEKHLARCISSIKPVTTNIVVVDSYSTDTTLEIAYNLGARVIQRSWMNYASQFNWALGELDQDTDWVLRIDADEYLTPELADDVINQLPRLGHEIDGIYIDRRMKFQGRLIRYGGVYPLKVLRMFRYGRGKCENRWMDEHIKVIGSTVEFRGELIDDNQNSLTWWTDKHNKYASREVVDLLNLEYNFIPYETVASLKNRSQTGVKRWLKENVYARLPGGHRAFAYFIYRYLFCLGFLDGREGFVFHFLQGFWYRYLVDAKLVEVKRYMMLNGSSVVDAIDMVLGIRIAQPTRTNKQ